jgi:Ca2+-transporting ATPase
VSDYPLSRELLAMSRVWRSPDRRELLVAAKGAPEAIVDLCHLPPPNSSTSQPRWPPWPRWLARAGRGSRHVRGRGLPAIQHDFDFEFVGLVALQDPVRADVPAAINECHAAGIRVAMITGDHPATALAIARQAGLKVDGGHLTGSELDALDDAALAERLRDTQVFCRVRPEQKLRLVQAFRARGDVVAMTGDGVNDAPALKAAHIGVAMGGRGTDVAREAADLVLLNDDFGSLVTTIRYGRRVFANLRKAITSCWPRTCPSSAWPWRRC